MTEPRTSFHFPKEAAAALAEIASFTRFTTGASTVRAALCAYSDLLEVSRAGCKIFVRDDDGREWSYSPFAPFDYPGFEKLTRMSEGTKAPRRSPKNFFFSGAALEELNRIRERSFLNNNADAIRAALTAFNELVRVVTIGDEIVIRDPDGNERLHDPRMPLVQDGLNLTGVKTPLQPTADANNSDKNLSLQPARSARLLVPAG